MIESYQTTNFRLFQTERVCRRQFQIWRKWQKVIQTGRKHCGKRRNCSSRAISAFPTVFSKGFFLGASKGVIVWGWVNHRVNEKTAFRSWFYNKEEMMSHNTSFLIRHHFFVDMKSLWAFLEHQMSTHVTNMKCITKMLETGPVQLKSLFIEV